MTTILAKGFRQERSLRLAVGPVAIIGAGTMGAEIAAANVRHSRPVVIIDSNPQAFPAAARRIASELADGNGPPSQEVGTMAARLVTTTTELAEVENCDLVLESIVENAAVKQKLFGELEPHLAPGAILASNTSTIPISRLATGLSDPGRLCGLHFLHPVRHRPLVEIVRGPHTSDRTIAVAIDYVRAIHKVPLLASDGPGFVVNRLLMPYLGEAMDLLLEGATIEQIERTANDFGMSVGPLRLADQIGLDTLLLAGRVLWEAFPERVLPSPLLIALYKAKRYGRKTGAGFLAYAAELGDDDLGRVDPTVEKIIATWARDSRTFSNAEIIVRLLLPMVLEATRILEEKKVGGPSDIDLAMVHGLGFPASEGGLLQWADRQGARAIVAALERLKRLGPRMRPSRFLMKLAYRKARFYC